MRTADPSADGRRSAAIFATIEVHRRGAALPGRASTNAVMEPTRRSLHVATGINNVALRLQCKSQLQLPNITVIGKLILKTAVYP